MNYGYDNSIPLWKEERKHLLATRLQELAKQYNSSVEVDEMYAGVRLRRLTELSAEDLHKIVEIADRIFIEVMS
jgi:hypothetical protein